MGAWQTWLRFVIGLAVVAVGFDIEAHDAVGQTAASAMDQQAVRQVKRLLGGQDASDVAGWGHQVDSTYPGTARLHFQVHDDSKQPFCGAAESRVAKCEDNICLLTAIKHFYGKVLQDEGRKIEFPNIDYSKVAKGIKFTDADAVKMLINLLGDLHQPMHVGFAGDDSGRKAQVTFRGRTMSLFDFWDKGISEAVRKQESGFWLGGWTHVRAINDEFVKDKDLWKKEGAFKSFDRWLSEAVEFACKKAYVHPITGKRLAGPGAEAHPVALEEDAYQVWREAWLRQILLAGERVAIVLNDILDAGGAAKLNQGTGVKTKMDEEVAKTKEEWAKARAKVQQTDRATRGSRFDMGALVTNLSIAVVVVPLFFLVANFGLSPRTYSSLIRSLMESNNGSNQGAGPRSTKRYE